MAINTSSASNAPPIDRRYTHLTQIGAGGMGIVYSAKDRLYDRSIALKSVLGNFVKTESGGTAFDRRLALAEEFQTLASLRHPNIISVIDYGFDANRQPYFTMDLLDKPETILQVARRTPDSAAKIDLLVQAFQAIAYLHRRGIIHRDLKPGNILVQNGQVKLLDFGLATAKQEGDVIVGTPAYIAPEILWGEPATPASDLYAMGVILYEMFTGQYPFDLTDINRLIASIMHEQPNLTPFITDQDRTILKQDISVAEPIDQRHGNSGTVPITIAPIELSQAAFMTIELNIPPPIEEVTRVDVVSTLDSALKASLAMQDTPEQQQIAAQKSVLGGIVQRLLSKNPRKRYQSANEVIRELEVVLGRPLLTETSATRESFLQAAKFIGRQAELAQLSASLTRAIEGVGSIWLVSGENGVGKSRLLDELRIAGLVGGAFALRGRAAELDAPYQMWREPLRRLVLNTDLSDYDAGVLKEILADMDDLLDRPVTAAPIIEPDQASKRLLSVISSLFSRQKQPMLILLEDLHWARAENLTVLEQITQMVAGLPLLIVGSYRTDERLELAPTLRTLPTLHLKRLTSDEIVSLTDSMLGDATKREPLHEFLQRETEGNPLFIIEVVRALAEETGKLSDVGVVTLPPSLMIEGIQRLLQRRLARVSTDDYSLLQIAAMIGREVDLKVMRAAKPDLDIAQWLLRCSDAAVLEIRDEQWQFSHDKLRQEVLRELPTDKRPQCYEDAAKALEAVYPDVPDYAPLLMYLWAEANQPQKERQYAIIAGEQAYQSSAYRDAITYLQRANTLLAADSASDAQAQRGMVLVDLAKSATHLNHYADAIRLAEESLALEATANAPAIRAEALYTLGYTTLYQGDPAKATQLLEQSLTLYQETANQRGISEALRGLARINSAQGNYATGAQYLEESLTSSQQAKNLWDEAKAYMDLGYTLIMQGNFEQAEPQLEHSISIARSINYQVGIATVLLMRGLVAHFRNQSGRSTEYLLESLAISKRIGDRRLSAEALNNLGSYAAARKEYAEAESWLAQSLQISRELKFRWGIAATLVNLGHAASGAENSAQAKQYFREAVQYAGELNAMPLTLESIAGFARLIATEGNTSQALEWVGLVTAHAAINPDIKSVTDPLLAELSAKLPADEVQQHLDKGKTLGLEDMVAVILASSSDTQV